MDERRRTILLIVGILLLVFGVSALAQNLGIVPPFVHQFFDLLRRASGPLALVVVGVIVILAATGRFRPEMPGPGQTIHKSRNKVVAGVAAGLAEYVQIDPIIVRLLFVVLALGSFFSGVLVYVILAVVMPDPPEEVGYA